MCTLPRRRSCRTRSGSHVGRSNARSWVDGPPTAPRIAGGVGYVHVVGPAGADRVDHFPGSTKVRDTWNA